MRIADADGAQSRALDCVLVHYGHPAPTLALAETVSTRPQTMVWLVDNADNLGEVTAPALERLRPRRNLGFGQAINLAAARGSAPWLLVLNPDVSLTPAAIDAMVSSLMQRPSAALLAPRLRYPDGRPQINGGRFSGWIVETARAAGLGPVVRVARARLRGEQASPEGVISRDWVSGAAMLLRREAFTAVGGFDPGFFLYFEDEDLCRRLRVRGWDVVVLPTVCVAHVVGGTSDDGGTYGHPAYEASRVYYHRRHSGAALRWVVEWSSRRRLARRETADGDAR